MQSPSLASPKTLKLHARKQRAQSGQQTSNGPLNLSGIFGSSQLSNSIFQSSGGNWQSQAPGADAADVYERFDYLSKLKEENEALMSLLKEVQLNKEDLSKRMHELEMTRDAILSLRPSVTRDMIDTYLSDTCPLASKNRPGLNLTTTQSVQAREIYDRMLGVAAIYRANQAELQDFLMQHLVKASDHFINDETADCMAAIDRLESIVRAGPRNIASAQDLARNFEESIFLASADRFAELLRDEVSKRNPAPVDRGFNESKIDAAVVEHQQAEIAQLTAQNDNLRNTVTELREKIAKLKVAGQQPGKGAKSRVTGGSSGKNASPATTNDKSATAATGDFDDFDVEPTTNGVEGAAAGSGEGAGLHALQEEAATVAERAPWLVTLLHEKIHHYAQQIVDRHPLASPLTPEATRLVTQQVAHEVTHGTGLVLFLGLLKGALQQSAHRVYHTRIEQLLSGDLSEEQAYATETTAPGGDDDLFAMDAPPASAANDAKPLSQLLLDFVSQLLRLTALHNDVACFATLFLTYLRQRLQITAPVAASSPAASTPPAASSSSGTPLNLRPAVPVKSPTLAGVATAALAIPSLRRSANKKAAAQPQQATTSSQQQYTNPDNFFSSTNNTGSAPSPAYGVDDFMTGGGGGAGEPYLYRTRSGDSGDDTGGFPRRKSSPRDNLPRYMLPKNMQVTPGGAVRSRGGGGDGALADNASRASGSRR